LGKRRNTADWVREAAEGRRTAIGYFVQEFDLLLLKTVRRHLGASRFRNEGDDLLQALKLAIITALPKLRGRDRPAVVAWLNKLIRSRILDWERSQRAAKRRPESTPLRLQRTGGLDVASRAPTPHTTSVRAEEIERVRKAIDLTPERYRPVLRFILEKAPQTKEIAAFVRKEQEAARKFSERAVAHLQRALRELDETASA